MIDPSTPNSATITVQLVHGDGVVNVQAEGHVMDAEGVAKQALAPMGVLNVMLDALKTIVGSHLEEPKPRVLAAHQLPNIPGTS